jgi:hypothetical protein
VERAVSIASGEMYPTKEDSVNPEMESRPTREKEQTGEDWTASPYDKSRRNVSPRREWDLHRCRKVYQI